MKVDRFRLEQVVELIQEYGGRLGNLTPNTVAKLAVFQLNLADTEAVSIHCLQILADILEMPPLSLASLATVCEHQQMQELINAVATIALRAYLDLQGVDENSLNSAMEEYDLIVKK